MRRACGTGAMSLSRVLPREFRAAARLLEDRLPRLLGSNLVGIYLYGSALDSSFVPGRSDLDCIAVTREALDPAAFECLGERLHDALREEAGFARIQMSILVRDRVLDDDPTACLYQFGHLSRSGSDGNPIIWLDFFQRGVVLHGPDPREFVPKITPEILQEALFREIGYLREEISTKPESEWRDRGSYRAYAVLTLCRILYSNATGRVTPKTSAARWAIDHTPGASEFDDLIRAAEGVSNEESDAHLPLSSIEEFIDYVAGHVREPTG